MSQGTFRRAARRIRRAILAAGPWLGAALALAQFPPPVGEEFPVNTYTPSRQVFPWVALDAAGEFVVVWESYEQDGGAGGYGVFGQRFDAGGQPAGGEFAINTTTSGSQEQPAVVSDPAGNFVVVWSSPGQDGSGSGVIGRRYDETGLPLTGEFLVNSFTTGDQNLPVAAADGAGNFVVAWAGFDGVASRAIFAQRFDADGDPVGDEFQVNTYTEGYLTIPAVAADASGRFVVVWTSEEQDGSGRGIFGQRFAADGQPAGEEFQVNTYTTGRQDFAVVGGSPGGDFMVVWSSQGQDGSNYGSFAQRYDADGNELGGEFRVNGQTAGNQLHSAVAADAPGNFVVTWASYGQDGSYWGLFAKRYDPAGNPVSDDVQVNTYTTESQFHSFVAAEPAGDFVVVWESYGQDGDGFGLFGQRFLGSLLFADGFESGTTGAWGQTIP